MHIHLSKRTIVTVCIITAIVVVTILSVARRAQAPQNIHKANEQGACTMDAKICPDGSAVGRSGPDCAFKPCPTQTPPKAIAARHELDFRLSGAF